MALISQLSDPQWWLEKATTDLYFLSRNIMQILEDPTPGYKDLYYPTHKKLCDFLTKYANPGQRCLILMPRGWIKSYITEAWLMQNLIKNWIKGERKFFLLSHATQPNAEELLWRIRYNLMYNDFLRFLLSQINEELAKQLVDPENTAERWTKEEIVVAGCRISTGAVEKALASRHFWGHLGDDLVIRENSLTEGQLIKTVDWWKLARSLLLAKGVEVLVGTRYHFNDLYGTLIDRFIKTDFEYHRGEPITELHKGNFHLFYADCWVEPEEEKGSTFPTLFSEEYLKQLKEEQEEEFNYQYRNWPIARGQQKYQKNHFKWYKESEIPSIVHTVMVLDVTDKEKETSDHTGMVVADLGVDKKVYIRLGTRKRVTDANLLDWMIKEACIYQPSIIAIESLKYDTLVELLELILPQKFSRGEIPEEYREYVKTIPSMLHEVKHRGRPKKIRIENMAGYVERGTVLFPHRGAKYLIEELLRLGTVKIDDTADAFGYLQDVLVFPKATDPVKILAVPDDLKKTDEELEKEEWERTKNYIAEQETEGFLDEMEWY